MRGVGAARSKDDSAELIPVFSDAMSADEASADEVLADEVPAASVLGSGALADVAGPGSDRHWWSWLAVAAAALLVGGVVVQGRGPTATPPPHPSNPPAAMRNASPVTSAAPAAVVDLGRRLLAVPADWDLFGRGPGVLIRLQLERGCLTVTPLPADSGSAPAALLPLPGRVVIRPTTFGVGYVVADGAAPTRLLSRLGQAGPAVPGPRPDQVWIRTSPATQDTTRMTLMTGSSGRPGVSVVVPGDGYLSGDGAGHIVYTNRVDNVSYLTAPGRWQVRTSGQVLAVGANAVVTIERNRSGRYSTALTDVPSGRRHVWAASPGAAINPVLGPIAPDGRTAAILSSGSTATTLTVLDLRTGTTHGRSIALAGDAESVAWSPDGRRLFAATAAGQVVTVDARTGAARPLGLTLPRLTQLVLRATPSR